MSEERDKLRKAMMAVGGHLQDLQAEQNATTRELGTLQQSIKRLEARSVHSEAVMAALGGTFASIEQILGDLLVERERVTAVERTVAELAQRVEVLEKKAS